MNNNTKIYLKELMNGIDTISNCPKYEKAIEQLSESICNNSNNGKITAIFGNGGSAADAQHFSAELVGTFKNKKRKPYKAIALTTDSSFITAWSNDFEYSSIFERQIKAFSNTIGLSIALSTSGKSKNILQGLQASASLGIQTILITGNQCPNYDYVNNILRLPSNDTSIVQTLTQVMYHLICIRIESYEILTNEEQYNQ